MQDWLNYFTSNYRIKETIVRDYDRTFSLYKLRYGIVWTLQAKFNSLEKMTEYVSYLRELYGKESKDSEKARQFNRDFQTQGSRSVSSDMLAPCINIRNGYLTMQEKPTSEEIKRTEYYLWKKIHNWPSNDIIALCSYIIGKASKKKVEGK